MFIFYILTVSLNYPKGIADTFVYYLPINKKSTRKMCQSKHRHKTKNIFDYTISYSRKSYHDRQTEENIFKERIRHETKKHSHV